MIENFVVFYKNIYNEYRVYDYQEKTYKTIDRLPKKNNFSMFSKYSLSKKESLKMTNEEITVEMDIRLQKYADDLIIWAEEIKNCKSLMVPFDILASHEREKGSKRYRDNYELIFLFFYLYGSRKDLFININKNKISHIEFKWFENCFNSGLTYLREKKTTYNCYGYDFSLNYPNLMSSKEFQFPIKEGTEMILTELPKKLKYGIYKIKFDINTITNNFNVVFKIQKSNCYTHYELNFIKKKFPEIKFELIQDKKPNCLLYNDEDIITGFELFYPWMRRIQSLREELPNNFMVKHFASKLWGVLIEGSVEYLTQEEYDLIDTFEDSEHELIDVIVKKDGRLIYEVAKKSKFYKKNIRIKPFLTAFARINCAKLALSKINNVVRICVDSVVFDEPLSHTLLNKFKNLKTEDKTTGQIYFEHVNNYEKIGENPKINKTVHHYEEDEELLLLEKELMDKF
jgi:hypothetical protein